MSRATDFTEQQKDSLVDSQDLYLGQTISIKEGETVQHTLEREDIEYLRSEWDKIKVSNDGRQTQLTVKNYVGIIGLPSGASLSIRPKIECELLYLLAYSGRVNEELVYDAEEAGFEPGDNLEQILAQLFARELERVLQQGLQQEYQQQDQTQQHLRGQLRVQQQLERQGTTPTAFECRYSELTHDTPLNRVVLTATSRLCSWLSPSPLRSKLLQHRGTLRKQVSDQPVSVEDFKNITLTHLDRHYRRIVALAELILKEQFISGLEYPDRPLPSMVFNMPNVFESVVVNAVRSVIDRSKYRVTEEDLGDLAHAQSGNETRSLKPDLVFRDKTRDGAVFAIGDAKWKDDQSPSSDDFYQLAAYQGHEGTPGVIVYPDSSETKHETYEYVGDTASQGQLFVRTLGLQITDDKINGYDDYVDTIETNAEKFVNEDILSKG